MNAQGFAIVFGIIYIAVGILGYIPAALQAPPADAPELAVSGLYGYLFGLFPVNWLHSAAHLLLGVWGVIAWKNYRASVTYARGLAIVYGVLFVFGLFPVLRTAFGLMPLFGHDIWLHALTAIVAAYFGFFSTRSTPTGAARATR